MGRGRGFGVITLSGYPLSHKQSKLVLATADHALDYLMSSRLKKTLEIEIKIQKDLYLSSGIFGDVGLEEDGKSPKLFDMRLNYSGVQSFGYLVIVLCHELIHVSQYAKNRLRYFQRDNRIAFCNVKYDWDNLKYDDRPWEIEAHKMEGEVFYHVLDQAPEIQEYLEAKACDSWEPKLTL